MGLNYVKANKWLKSHHNFVDSTQCASAKLSFTAGQNKFKSTYAGVKDGSTYVYSKMLWSFDLHGESVIIRTFSS